MADATYSISGYKHDVFLSHDWGKNEENHERVKKINALLKKKHISTWIDDEKIAGNLDEKMAQGIEDSSIGLIFVTKAYLKKVGGKGANGAKDNCYAEFGHMTRNMGPERMIPIVMEKEMLDQSLWSGKLGLRLGGDLYIDMSGSMEQKIDELVESIKTKKEMVRCGSETNEQGIVEKVELNNLPQRDGDTELGSEKEKSPGEGTSSYCSTNRRRIIIMLVVLILFLGAAIGLIIHFTSPTTTTTASVSSTRTSKITTTTTTTTIATPNIAPNIACDICNCTSVSVDCRSLNMTFVPPNIPKMTETLYLSDNKLSQLHPTDFGYLQELRVLDLGHNHIATLPHKLFDNFKRLDSLNMNGNQLTSLPEDIFRPLTQLTKLILSDNKFTTITSDLLVNQPGLLYLWLDGNHLNMLPNNFLSNQHDLSVLLLNNNKLKNLPEMMLQHNRKLELVYLQENPLVCSCGLYNTLVDKVEGKTQVVGMCDTVKNISSITHVRRGEFC